MAMEFVTNAKGQKECRDDEIAPGVVGRGKTDAAARLNFDHLVVSTWHPARAGKIQESIDCLLDGGHPNRESLLELQRFFDDSIGHLRRGSEAWDSQDNANVGGHSSAKNY